MDRTDKAKPRKSEPAEKNGGKQGNTLHSLIDSMTLINKSYIYEFASADYCRDHGRTKKEVVGSSVSQVFGDANFNRFIKKYLDQCFAGNVIRYENWLDFPGEEEGRYYRVSYSPYCNAAGEVTHVVVASQDITDLKKEEQALDKSAPTFRTILKNMQYGVMTFDTEGNFTFVNDVLIKRSGYPKMWYSGKNLFDVVSAEEREKVREHFHATVRGEEVPPYRFSFRKATDDPAWAQINSTAIREDGHVVGVLAIMLDVTKLMQSEQALRASEEKYRRLFEDSRDAIFIAAKDGALTDVNTSFLNLFGYTKQEAEGLHAVDTYVNRQDCKAYVKAIEGQGFVDYLEVKLKKKNGAIMTCLLNGTPLRGSDGSITGYQGIIRVEAGKN